MPKAKPTTPRAENTKTCQPFRRVRPGSSKNAVSSLLIGITGKSCAKLAQYHLLRSPAAPRPARSPTTAPRRQARIGQPKE